MKLGRTLNEKASRRVYRTWLNLMRELLVCRRCGGSMEESFEGIDTIADAVTNRFGIRRRNGKAVTGWVLRAWTWKRGFPMLKLQGRYTTTTFLIQAWMAAYWLIARELPQTRTPRPTNLPDRPRKVVP